ncbi:MAG: winged helix-turn-helix domain-containing protein, partial [Bryobacteraceae bacterium]|nr:winged helix-turn-helix domain-containing protein [Bryobacteraceae bacterium]
MPRCQFGVFDFAPETAELWRNAMPVRLQAQPAQVLAVLLATPGETVTRETLRAAVWGSDTYVDFDRGLNFCIAQIRSALGDSADSPRYIRTFPRKGYQFIAPVNTTTTAATANAEPAPAPAAAPP